MTARFRLGNQGRAREKRDPIEFSFHDLDFLCIGAFEIHSVNRISEGRERSGHALPFVDGWKFFVSRSSCSACSVWKRSTISITLRRLISLAMEAPIPFDSLGTTATFSVTFLVFIVIPFVVEISKRVRASQP